MAEKERVDAYLEIIKRLEPDIAMVDAGAYGTSIAISLKRIADSLANLEITLGEISQLVGLISRNPTK